MQTSFIKTSNSWVSINQIYLKDSDTWKEVSTAWVKDNNNWKMIHGNGKVSVEYLRIPRQLQTVQTFGAVNVPKQIVYYPGLRYRSVIRQSGGFGANAYRKRGYAVYANGQVSNAKQFLFFRSNPVIRPVRRWRIDQSQQNPSRPRCHMHGHSR